MALGAGSNMQTSTAQSTPEAELASLQEGMKKRGESAFVLWNRILKRFHVNDVLRLPYEASDSKAAWKIVIFLHEDNTVCIHAAKTGRNPTMKTLERNFGVSVAWLNERLKSGEYVIVHCGSKNMSADIYTKGFTDKCLWERLNQLTNVFTPEQIKNFNINPAVIKDEEDIVIRPVGNLNTQYYEIMKNASLEEERKPI